MINPDAVMARKPEEVEAAIELARAAGVSEALLERMGGYTGCVGVLDTGRPGPVTTLRFDIDCLAIEELFDANKLDQKTLEATFARYNELTQPARTPTSAAASTRKQSHRQSALLRLRNEPEGPSLHGRHGHERRDRVLDVETDQPIPGLFAAGEFVGGIHGAVMDCLVNGRQAGLSAAKDKL